jgi:hypothetical protein
MSDPVEVVTEKAQPPQPGPLGFPIYSASSIVLYGIPIPFFNASVGYSNDKVNILTWPLNDPNNPPPIDYHLALIYGYQYQGHCYSLPEPMGLVVPNNQFAGPAVGCGYDSTPGGPFGYTMWVVDKLERSVQLQITNDTFEELLLRRSMAGARPPLSYRAARQLAHRSGQLIEK